MRMVSAAALADDPLRTLRAVRIATELALDIEPATGAAVAANAAGLDRVAPERVFGELKRIVGADDVRRGIGLMDAHGLTEVVLPELHRAARDRAERLPPRRRARAHARGARGGRAARSATRRRAGSATRPRPWPRCWRSRSPTS